VAAVATTAAADCAERLNKAAKHAIGTSCSCQETITTLLLLVRRLRSGAAPNSGYAQHAQRTHIVGPQHLWRMQAPCLANLAAGVAAGMAQP
jgi:hypothetical protein